MLSIDTLRGVARQLSDIPTIVAIGLLVIVLGVGIDLGVHTLAPHAHVDGVFDPSEHMAHLIVVVGMALTLAGVVADGVRRQIRPTSLSADERSTRDAVR
jgi:ribose/xylose/arabinose/galactoside ABC-type transport system permease subunit